jgi:peptidoglycan/LPS O-acetylase OafA/YrhL
MGFFERSPYFALAVACVLVLGAALLMWNFVEKRFLLRSSHYITSERDAAKP